jgi:hypothetical protein
MKEDLTKLLMQSYDEGVKDALDSVKEALAAQEPVAWLDEEKKIIYWHNTHETDDYHGFKRSTPLYTTPQQRKPLTDDARGLLVIEHLGPNALLHKPMSIYDVFHMGIDAAEAAHGIKESE